VPGGKVSNYMTGKVDAVAPSTSVYDLITRFVQNHYRRLPVTDSDGRLLGQVSRRDVLAVIESMEDNSFLYGTEDHHLTTDTDESLGVDSAMRRAKDR
jgi:CBS-domain-containing membrane protein